VLEKGFIDMERDPADRRAYRLIPTEYSDRVFED
jgi:DNA-binding MarR family transcriptional regulator